MRTKQKNEKIMQFHNYSLKFSFWRKIEISSLILQSFKAFLKFPNWQRFQHVKKLLRCWRWHKDDGLFSWDGWPTNSWKLYFQKGSLSGHSPIIIPQHFEKGANPRSLGQQSQHHGATRVPLSYIYIYIYIYIKYSLL